ncbi:MAG: hypothetical protein QNK23_14030 [Crocinitomicaceae bacterium]|nr:hypothetical protein [Crocinitomicaceae bacterium]
MFRWIFIGVLLMTVAGCEVTNEEPKPCVQEGIFEKEAVLSLSGDLRLDSIQFSDGLYRYQLQGLFKVNGQECSCMVFLNNNPLDLKMCEVVSHELVIHTDQPDFRCTVYASNEQLVLAWEYPGKRLKLMYDLVSISAH